MLQSVRPGWWTAARDGRTSAIQVKAKEDRADA
jgi:hypothetical protein